ncbi:CCR4-Not complex 3'-5'-exoribonuclease subunit Ccr4 [Sporobolomyces koalae]|uniref:CCR4-Not complex 3'-5'-exoribonuclease subunit Ccr4 n=1 Tax=Sporobolomyces koalae TaxID=500713 RepID=UPI003173AF17
MFSSYSPSPSPAPASPPPNSHLYSPGGAGASNGSSGPGSSQQGGAGNAGGASNYSAGGGPRYSLLNKLQGHHGHYQQGPNPQHLHHHFSSYPGGPPSSPAYSNGPSHPSQQQQQQQQHNSHSHHSSPHPSNSQPPNSHPQQPPPPPPSHHLSNPNSGPNGSPHPSNQPLSAHWAQQLTLANNSRRATSPHHYARAAHLAARGQTTSSAAPTPSSAIPITDPNRPGSVILAGKLVNGSAAAGGSHRKDASTDDTASGANRSASVASTRSSALANGGPPTPGLEGNPVGLARNREADKDKKQTWTTLDIGGMHLKNLSPELFRYAFLTTLYIPHNALTELPTLISKLTHLTHLDASSNKLSSVPPQLGLLTRLRELFLFDNHLTSLPPQLGTLHLLDTLGIEGNPLPDTLRSLIEKDGTTGLISYLRDSCPVQDPPPERPWLSIEPEALPQPDKRPEETFSLMCYNVLCDRYATPQLYGYTPSWALSWEYRKELILQEVLLYGSDIICLQEVDTESYENYFAELLSSHDYDGVHYPKSRARTMSGDERRGVDGCATFFKNTKFALVEQQLIEFNQIAMRRPDFKKTEDMFNRVMTKDQIAVVTLLEHRASGARLIVANTHIHWDPEFRDVKLVQVAMLMDEVSKIAADFARLPARMNLAEGYDKAPSYSNGTKIPTIVCGDFNSIPESGVYEFLSRGSVEKDHEDFMSHVYGHYTSDGLSHKFNLKSAYSHINELSFTNYTSGFTETIDYMYYTSQSMGVTGLLGEVDRSYLEQTVGFPNAHFPSDHISLLAEFKIK